MPNYDYKCTKCGHQIEIFHKIIEKFSLICPHCQEEKLQKIPSGHVGLNFVGDGFYKTMYADKNDKITPNSASNACCPCGKNKNSCT